MSTDESRASPIVLQVYHEHLAHFGQADDAVAFDRGVTPPPEHMPKRVDVLVWHPTPEVDITTFATIGMCDKPMKDAEHRAELHFAVRKNLSPDDVHTCALFLANLSTYPFHYDTHLDWWHKLKAPGSIPVFRNAKSVLMHPRFVSDGWDRIDCEDGTVVKLLNVIPISAEASMLRSKDELLHYVWDELGDPFAPW